MDSSRFKSVIENHPIFEKLASTDSDSQTHTKPDQLIHIEDGNLFLWNNKESCLHVSNLRISLDEPIPSVQTFLCTSPPLFEVKSITFNGVGNLVALIGSRGVSVLTLPQRWHRNDDTQEEDLKTVCICIPIAERYFMTCIAVQLLQASWHPGSSTNSHLCLLLSDNTFRIFDVTADNQTPVQVHKLGHFSNIGSSRLSLVSSAYSISTAIGETVISFAFAPPVEVLEKKKRIFQAKQVHEQTPAVLLYPVYLLQGDGDVLLLLTSVTDKRYRRGLMHGPLTMRPPAEDNYGVDACSILVLKCTPTVIAIATASGKIHHCVALSISDYDSDDDFTETQSTSSWPASVLSVKSGGLPGSEFPAPTLFVYETVEIDLDLMKNPEDEEEIQNRAITLHLGIDDF